MGAWHRLSASTMCPDTQRAATTQCQYPGCTKSVWKDPDGSYSSFCGNTHRLAMANNPRSQSRMCKVGWHFRHSGNLVSYTDAIVKELQYEACVHRERTGYVFPLFWWLRAAPTRGASFFQHTNFVGDGAPENSIIMVSVPVARGPARLHGTICAPFPDVEIEHLSTQMEKRRNTAPIATDCMFLDWLLP